MENNRARALLERGLVSHVQEILWRSALLAAALSIHSYSIRPKAFEFDFVFTTFVIISIGLLIIKFHSFLIAAARFRNRSPEPDDS